MAKFIEMPQAPTLGISIATDNGRSRKVGWVEYSDDTKCYTVGLDEDEQDRAIYEEPRLHLGHLDAMKERGWSIANEQVLRGKLASQAP
ncbi:hypothetical protein WME94_41310 [Sorangium sp. So ce429]